MTEPLHLKFRPSKWEHVVGHGPAVKALRGVIDRKESHTFLFSGPSGVGKTTLARLAAKALGARPEDVIDIDAADKTGVDDMRAVKELAAYRPFGTAVGRYYIVDECHRLSGAAWDTLLKVTEEPPDHVYWFFCTTLVSKVPATMRTRCTQFALKSLSEAELDALLSDICGAEKLTFSDQRRELIVEQAHGSARQLLQNISLVCTIESNKEAAEILRTAVQSEPVLELCRMLVKGGGSWQAAMNIYRKLDGQSPEGVRIQVCNYMAKAIVDTKQPEYLLHVLDVFASPYNDAEKGAPLLLSIGLALHSKA